MSLRADPIVETAQLPDGREAVVRVGVPVDPYIAQSELDTVSLEVTVDGVHTLAVNTVFDADDDSAARALAREVRAKLESGEAEPTAHDLEPLAETLR